MSAPTLDRCRDAIAEKLWQQFFPYIAKGTTLVDVFKPFAEELARACIGALLPVSDEMVDITLGFTPEQCDRYHVKTAITAAITAVLGEKA